MIFQFPGFERRFTLQRSPLARAIAVVRYPLVSAFAEVGGLRQVQHELREAFPALESSPATQFEVTIGPNAIQQQQTPLPQWVFSGHESEYQLVITPALLQLSVPGSRYIDRRSFASVLELVLRALQRSDQVQRLDGFTVRYINAMAADDNWAERWNPALIGWINDANVHALGRFSMTQTALNGGSVTLPSAAEFLTNAIVRHGLVGGAGPELLQNAASTPAFIVDCELVTTQVMAFDVETAMQLFLEYNHEMARFFDFALSDAGRLYFGLEYI
jgi:uncharacterized protein (TIGR04255 family)